jgi:hypothetical protein
MKSATRLERETDALFVGETTGGVPNHFGDAQFAHGPASKIPYIIANLQWQDSAPFDEREWILPDVHTAPGSPILLPAEMARWRRRLRIK